MSVLNYLLLFVLSTVAFCGNCQIISTSISPIEAPCGFKKYVTALSVQLEHPQMSQEMLITPPCIRQGMSRLLAKKISACVPTLLKRCQCELSEMMKSCVRRNVGLCAGRSTIEYLNARSGEGL